ncbi:MULTISPECIES: YggT family protein [Colwellia]|uniref:YGGT family protein n=1 Tax=Colwellia psychrerythraea (strain 34H / ATCC BAA-681) TaxID=167879 RepID=Q47XY7_COLP3|nr:MULTISPECIES: YggT family protein [Colwellia]AAZ24545.1 YGGT family protein [Colwellia psychrerythraea 34H]PKH86703.1 YggT family protein [Colwellia sp. Bg11-28]
MEAIIYLLRFAFDALLMILIMRVWLQWVKADFYNPLSQFIVKVSNPLVIPLRRVIPGLGGFDLATILIAYVVATLKFVSLAALSGESLGVLAFYIGLLVLLKQAGFLLFVIMIIMAIMSWVVQGYNSTLMVLSQLTEPFLNPIRKIIPNMGGLDLSMLLAFLLMNVINILLSNSLPYWGAL